MNDQGLYFKVRLDNGKLKVDIADAEKNFKGLTSSVQRESRAMENALSGVKAGIAGAFTLAAAQNFASQVVKVRGEIQALEGSFRTLLGSKAQGDKMLAEVRKYATETPYGLQDISKAAQTMLAFNIDAQKVIPTLKQMGDIAMGDGQKLQSLVLAFSQMSSTGRLMGQDLLQMINAGFNPLVQISEQTGKSMSTLKSEMEKGKISVEMVANAFASATSEGGKFHGMMEQQAQGINANLAQLEDAWINFYNEIGEKSEGLIVDSIQGLTHLIENYEQVGKAIGEIIVLYGSYKAALIAIQALHKASIALQAQMVIVQRAAAISQATLTTSQITATAVTRALQVAWSRLNATMLVNPYVLAAGAITALGYAIYKTATFVDDYEKSYKKLNEAHDNYLEDYQKEVSELDKLYGALRKTKEGTEQHKKAKDAIMNRYGEQIKQLQGESKEVLSLSDAYGKLKTEAMAAAQARALSAFTQDAENFKNKNTASIGRELQKELANTYGNDRGMELYSKVMSLISQGQAVPEKFFEPFNRYAGALGAGVGQSTPGSPANTVQNLVNRIVAQQKLYDDNLRLAKATFPLAEKALQVPEVVTTSTPTPKTELTDAEKNELARRKKRHGEALQREKEYRQELEQLYRESQMELTEKRIAAMDEGYEKELAQIEFNHKRMLFENEKRLKEALEKERDIQETLWEGDPKNADKIKAGEIFNRDSVTMETLRKNNPQAFQVYEEYLKLASELKEKSEKDVNTKIAVDRIKKEREAIDKLATYELKAREIAARFEQNRISTDRYNLETEREKDSMLVDIQLAEEKYISLNKALQQTKELLERLKKEYASKPTEKLKDDIRETEEQISSLGQEINEVEVDIDGLTRKLSKLDNKKFQEILSNYTRIARQLGQLGGGVGEFFTDLADHMETISVLVDESSSDFQRYSAIVQNAVNSINKIISSIQQGRAAEREFEQSKLEFAHSYSLALNEQLRLQAELNSNGFVRNYQGEITSGFTAMADAAINYTKALEALSEGEVQTGTKKKSNWGTVASSAGAGAVYGAQAGGWIGAAVGAIAGGVVGFFSSRKTVPVYEELLKVYPQLIDQHGELNIEIAKSLLNTNLLTDKTKLLVQDAVNWAEALQEAKMQISEIVNDLAGDLGNELQTALVDAFKSGEDAGQKMFEAVNRSLGRFVQNFLYSTVYSGIFDKFKERMIKALNPNEASEDILDIYDDLLEEALAGGETFNKLWEDFMKRASERGFDMSNLDGESRTGANKGLAAMSQDTAEELNGRFTAIQGHTYSMMNNIADIKSMFEVDQTRAAQQLVHLANIDINTSRLAAIETQITRMSSNIETITIQGIKMK